MYPYYTKARVRRLAIIAHYHFHANHENDLRIRYLLYLYFIHACEAKYHTVPNTVDSLSVFIRTDHTDITHEVQRIRLQYEQKYW